MANYNSSHTGAEIDSAVGRTKDTVVTAGTVAASSAVVVDANKDISGFRNVTLTGQIQAATINLTGDTTIGDGDTDNITINADVNSNIIPNTDNTFDLGSSSKQWKDLYVNGIGYIDQLGTDADPIAIYASSGEIDGTAIGSESASTGAFTTISASGNVDFNGDLDVDGTTNLDAVDIDGAVDIAGQLTLSTPATPTGSIKFLDTGGTSQHASIDVESDSGGMVLALNANSYITTDFEPTRYVTSKASASVMASSAGEIRMFTGGTGGDPSRAMTIDSSQRVGLGTTSPSSYDSYYDNLVVYENGNAGIAIIGSTSGETSLGFGDGTGAATYRGAVAYVHTSGSHQDKMFFKTAATNQMVIDSSGRVGIGTISPDTRLTIAEARQGNASDTILNQQILHLDDTTAWSSLHANKPSGGGINFSGVYNSSDAQIIFAGIRGLKENSTDGDYDGALVLGTIANGGNMTEKMRITSDGKVGIGTASPSSLLEVKGTGETQIYINSASGNNSGVRFLENGTNKWTIGHDQTDDKFFFYDFTTSSTRMVIESDGKVGIGTTSPRSVLHASDGTASGITARDDAIIITHSANPKLAFEDASEGSGDKVMLFNYFDETLHISSMTDDMTGWDNIYIASFNRDGNVGIGGTPSDKFQINFDSDFYEVFDGAGTWTTKRGNGTTGGKSIVTALSSGSWGTGGGYIDFKPRDSFAMRIAGDGNVGIGETSPSAKLHVALDDGTMPSVVASESALVLQNNSAVSDGCTLTIISGNENNSQICFGDEQDYDRGVILYNHNNDCFTFRTSGSGEDMRIDETGAVLFNTTTRTSTGNGGATFDPNSVGRAVLNLGSVNYTSEVDLVRLYNNNGEVGDIRTNGSGASFNSNSDYRLKENEVALSNALQRLNNLKPYRFNFKADPNTTLDGFFAHEVQEVVPEAVTGTKDQMMPIQYQPNDEIPEGKQVYDVKEYSTTEIDAQKMDASKLVPLLVAALQEADDKIDALTARIEALEA